MKFYLTITLIFLVLLTANSHSAKWEEIGTIQIQGNNIKIYADSISLQDDQNNKDHKKLWVKLELPEHIESNINNEQYRIRKEQYYFNCVKKLFTVSHIILINDKGETVYNSGSFDPFTKEYEDAWNFVIPDSGPNLIYKYSCGKEISPSTTEVAKKAKQRNNNNKLVKTESYSGGEITDGLDIKRIRWAKHKDYERLVFDIYKWGGYEKPEGLEPADKPGHFKITRMIIDNTLKIQFNGYRAFTANIPNFENSNFIRNISLNTDEENADDSGFLLQIELRKPVEYKVLELKSPARIVIDFIEEN